MNFLAFAFNDLLGPLIMIGPIKIALLAWVGLVLVQNHMKKVEQEPAPEMPGKK